MTPSITTATIPAQRAEQDRAAREDRGWSLVELVAAGGPDAAEAFGELYRRYHDTVLNYVIRRIWHRQTAEDLTADVFVKALGAVANGRVSRQGVDFGAYLTTAARNRIADRYKSAQFQRERLTGEPPIDEATDERADPAHAAVTRVSRAAVRAAMSELTADQRRCLELRFMHELTDKQTAALMGKQVGAIKALQYRATRALRARLEGEGFTR